MHTISVRSSRQIRLHAHCTCTFFAIFTSNSLREETDGWTDGHTHTHTHTQGEKSTHTVLSSSFSPFVPELRDSPVRIQPLVDDQIHCA